VASERVAPLAVYQLVIEIMPALVSLVMILVVIRIRKLPGVFVDDLRDSVELLSGFLELPVDHLKYTRDSAEHVRMTFLHVPCQGRKSFAVE
jgi:hypothetical protein